MQIIIVIWDSEHTCLVTGRWTERWTCHGVKDTSAHLQPSAHHHLECRKWGFKDGGLSKSEDI